MPSLSQLVARHHCVLLLDAASSVVHIGLLRRGAAPRWDAQAADANRGLFAATAECLAAAGVTVEEIGAFVYCEGPGSMLGVRTAAMAIRTWQAAASRSLPAFRYQSLQLIAGELSRRGTPPPFAVVADARRDHWHVMTVDATGRAGLLQRLAAAEVTALPGTVWTPASFRVWSQPPRTFTPCDYDPPAFLAALPDADLFAATDAPDAFQHDDPVYRKWVPGIHRAATHHNDGHQV
jgi:tRNA threonylcarbamoyladenosine biosynthesis protein TsaB